MVLAYGGLLAERRQPRKNNVIIENVGDGGHHIRSASNGAKQKPGSQKKLNREREIKC